MQGMNRSPNPGGFWVLAPMSLALLVAGIAAPAVVAISAALLVRAGRILPDPLYLESPTGCAGRHLPSHRRLFHCLWPDPRALLLVHGSVRGGHRRDVC